MSYQGSDILPTNIYFSPLALPQWHRINGHNVLEVLVDGNDYLKSFIKTLDHEIAHDQKCDHKNHIKKLLDTLRTYGWCVVSYYDDIKKPYKVYNPNLFEDWIKSTITITENGKEIQRIQKIGAIFNYVDELGNSYREECYFEDQFDSNGEITNMRSYFLIWEEGDGYQKRYLNQDSIFALSDLDLGILASAIAAHQVKIALEISAAKPFFMHFVLGEECTDPQAQKVKTQMGYVGPYAGFQAKRSVVDEIVKIENADIPNSIAALDKLAQGFANITRLPLSFFLGERQKGGLSETGDDSDEGDVNRRKGEILSRFNEICGDMLMIELGIILDTELYEKLKLEKEEKKDEELFANTIIEKGEE